jgi:hypothetical protein
MYNLNLDDSIQNKLMRFSYSLRILWCSKSFPCSELLGTLNQATTKVSHGWFRNSVEGVIRIHRTRLEEHARNSENVSATCAKISLTKVNKDSNCKREANVARPTGTMGNKKLIIEIHSPISRTL